MICVREECCLCVFQQSAPGALLVPGVDTIIIKKKQRGFEKSHEVDGQMKLDHILLNVILIKLKKLE